MLPTSEPFFLLVIGLAAVFGIAGVTILVLLPRSLELFRARWVESFRPAAPPAEGAPTIGLVASLGVTVLVLGGLFVVFGFLRSTGAVMAQSDNSAAVVIGAIVTIVGVVALLARTKLAWALATLSRMTYGRGGTAESLTPGVTLAIAIVVAVIGAAVLLWGLFG